MRTLLLSPFAPNVAQPHAAADTVVQLVPRLAAHTELFVYSTQPPGPADGLNYTPLAPTVARPTAAGPGRIRQIINRTGGRPAWLRQAWPRQATTEVLDLIARLKPQVVHAEYLQSAEVLSHHSGCVLGLHDITEHVMRESYRAATGLERAYRWAELVRTRQFERTAMRRAAAVLTLSEADLAIAAAFNRNTLLARPGIDLDERSWAPPDGGPPRLVFSGAMWRRANVLVAKMLAREVLPIVWRDVPTAQLRIVGTGPAPEVLRLADRDSRIIVTGEVPDPRTEMLGAHAVVLPSIVGGGVLMKVVHAMALGCPVVTSPGPAASVHGGPESLFVAGSPDEIAAAVQTILRSPDEARRRGAAARAHVGRTFRWDDTVRAYLLAYEIASQA